MWFLIWFRMWFSDILCEKSYLRLIWFLSPKYSSQMRNHMSKSYEIIWDFFVRGVPFNGWESRQPAQQESGKEVHSPRSAHKQIWCGQWCIQDAKVSWRRAVPPLGATEADRRGEGASFSWRYRSYHSNIRVPESPVGFLDSLPIFVPFWEDSHSRP